VKQLAEQYRALNGVPADVDLPVDAVTRSASGLDPHISVANAMLQAPRVAAKNELELEAVQQLIKGATQDPVLGIFGEPTVNVLKLNASLQERQGQP